VTREWVEGGEREMREVREGEREGEEKSRPHVHFYKSAPMQAVGPEKVCLLHGRWLTGCGLMTWIVRVDRWIGGRREGCNSPCEGDFSS